MAAVMSTTGTVTDETGTVHTGMHLEVRSNIATMRTSRGREIVAQRDQVATVGPLRGHTRVVTFADGSTWSVAAVRRPCGCGR